MTILECIGIFVTILLLIFIHSWRRNRDEIIPNWPIIGMLPKLLCSLSNLHDQVTLILKHHGGTFRFEGPWFSNTNYIVTSDPVNVHYIISKNFSNYIKGSRFPEIFEIFLGGIFTSDSHVWKQDRTILHSLLRRKGFEIFHQQTIQKKLENFLLPLLDHVAVAGAEVDLQDVINRFAFDSSCTIVLGFDPNCLPNKFTELTEIAHQKALNLMEEVVVYRHFIPSFLWKLQKLFHFGQEKKFKIAQEHLHRFLHERITSKYEEQKRFNSNNSSENEESHFDLIRGLMKEGVGVGNGPMGCNHLRDTALNLLAAGNGTISAGLSWFIWLVATHPEVEAKIVQEIKDNCLTKEEILITSVVENKDKLVYLHGALCEALRLYPPVPFEHKCTVKADILPSGAHVSPNTKILYNLYAMGRMEHIWGNDCMEFKPERWISERGSIIHVPSYKFIAFNGGPRSCMGKDISLLQMKMAAASILWKFHIQVVEGHSVTPRVSITLGMEHGLMVNVTKRCI